MVWFAPTVIGDALYVARHDVRTREVGLSLLDFTDRQIELLMGQTAHQANWIVTLTSTTSETLQTTVAENSILNTSLTIMLITCEKDRWDRHPNLLVYLVHR